MIVEEVERGNVIVDQVTQLCIDGIHHRESTGTGPVILKVASVTSATYSGNTIVYLLWTRAIHTVYHGVCWDLVKPMILAAAAALRSHELRFLKCWLVVFRGLAAICAVYVLPLRHVGCQQHNDIFAVCACRCRAVCFCLLCRFPCAFYCFVLFTTTNSLLLHGPCCSI